ncbi:unnamed protein product [Urochloa decumbens]|uniref:Uncharacterized protein n=1 Tax=Urochloa decumbens TaxID=240449 RepID=A0ABC9BSZ4_9POAL
MNTDHSQILLIPSFLFQENPSLMGKLFLMILNITRSGSGTMLVPMRDLGAMIGPATLTGQGTLRGEGTTCRTSRTEMCLQGRVSMPLHLDLARTKCHPVTALRTMLRATCLHLHLTLVVARQTTCKVVLLATRHKGDTPLVALHPTSKVVLLATRAGLLGIKAVTKVTKVTKAQLTKVGTLATKVVHQVTKVATPTLHPRTREATPTLHPRTKVVATLATVAAARATKAKEATRTTNEHDHERMQAPLFQSTLLESMVCSSINRTLVAV